MYKCNHFRIYELVPPHIYAQFRAQAWQFMDDRLLKSLDILRDLYGPIIINNYMHGGEREWSGLRTPNSPYYSPTSQHSFGRAADCLFRDTDVELVRKHIISKTIPARIHITAVELGTSWLHIDCRNVEPVKTFRP